MGGTPTPPTYLSVVTALNGRLALKCCRYMHKLITLVSICWKIHFTQENVILNLVWKFETRQAFCMVSAKSIVPRPAESLTWTVNDNFKHNYCKWRRIYESCHLRWWTWIYQYDPETKQQSKQGFAQGESGTVKFRSEKLAEKVMATVFWDSDRVILVDYLEGRITLTGAY